jgi:hypothetical protein
MECPNCKTETHVAVLKEEHIYPELFLGMPTFWRFMSPAVARLVTAVILAIGIALVVLALLWLSQGIWFMSLFAGLLAVFALYIFVICLKSLRKHQIKTYYKCGTCHLEWSGGK